MLFLYFLQSRLVGGITFGTSPFVQPFVQNHNEHDILKTNVLIVMQPGVSGLRAKTWNNQLWRLGRVQQLTGRIGRTIGTAYVRQLLDNFHPYPVEQNGSDCRQVIHYVVSIGNRCHFVLLDKDESCPTADESNIGRSNGPAYSTGELLNTPQEVEVQGHMKPKFDLQAWRRHHWLRWEVFYFCLFFSLRSHAVG